MKRENYSDIQEEEKISTLDFMEKMPGKKLPATKLGKEINSVGVVLGRERFLFDCKTLGLDY